jgi:hypothetical protein
MSIRKTGGASVDARMNSVVLAKSYDSIVMTAKPFLTFNSDGALPHSIQLNVLKVLPSHLP